MLLTKPRLPPTKAYRKRHAAMLAQYFRAYRQRQKAKLLEYGRRYRETRRAEQATRARR